MGEEEYYVEVTLTEYQYQYLEYLAGAKVSEKIRDIIQNYIEDCEFRRQRQEAKRRTS